jgi:hypothetical protein
VNTMSRKRKSQMVPWAIILIFLLVGCGTPPAPPTPIPPTDLPTSIPVTVTPQSTPSSTPEPIPEFEAIFEGNECIYSGPGELPIGDFTFVLFDQSDLKAELWLVHLTDGKTYQDLLDMQSAPGEWYPKPRWAVYGTRLPGTFESLESSEGRVDKTTWRFYLPGEYIVFCYVPSPQMLFYAGPIMVGEAISE